MGGMSNNLQSTEKRIQESLLALWERRLLIWLAARMPAWLNSDHLTGLGLGAMILAGIFYFLSGQHAALLHLVNLAILVNWFGDSLDGTLARYRQRQRPRYGFYVDHISDSLGVLCLFGGLGLSPFMEERVAFVLLAAYLLLSINSYLAAHVLGEFKISFLKIGPTELRILLVLGNCLLIAQPHRKIRGLELGLFDLGGLIATATMILILMRSVVLNIQRLYQMEPAVGTGRMKREVGSTKGAIDV